MKTLLKILAGALLLLVVVLGGAAIYITSFFHPDDFKPQITAAVEKAVGRKLTLTGPITLSVFPNIALSVTDAALSNAEWAGAEPFAQVKKLQASVALMPLLSKQIEITGVMVDGATLNLAQRGTKNNWTFAASHSDAANAQATAQPASAAIAPPQIKSITIKNSDIHFLADGKTTVITIKDAKTALDSLQPLNLTAEGSLNKAPFNVSVTGGSLGDILTNASNWPLKGNVIVAGTNVEFSGTVQQPQKFAGADMKFSANGNGRELAALTGSPLPFGAFKLSSQLSMTGAQVVHLSALSFSTGETQGTGDITLQLGGKPNVSGSLQIPNLNLADFAGGAPPQKQGMALISSAHAAGAQPIIPAIPLPTAALRAVNATIKLDLPRIQNAGQMLAGMNGTVKLDGGVMRMQPLALQYAGNAFAGDITLDGRADVAAISGTLTSDPLDYGKLLTEMKINDRVKGTGALSLNFAGNGKDTRQVAANSRGTFKLSSQNGQFDTGILLDGLGNVAKLALPGVTIPEIATLRCAGIEFTGNNGVWSSTQSAVDSDVMALTLTGDINLAEENLNLKANPNIKYAKAQGLLPTLKIAGAMNRPTITTDGSSVTQGLLTAAKLANVKRLDVLGNFLGGKPRAATGVTAPAGSCLAAVQRALAPAPSTAADTKPAPPKTKEELLNNAIQGGLKSLLGR